MLGTIVQRLPTSARPDYHVQGLKKPRCEGQGIAGRPADEVAAGSINERNGIAKWREPIGNQSFYSMRVRPLMERALRSLIALTAEPGSWLPLGHPARGELALRRDTGPEGDFLLRAPAKPRCRGEPPGK